MIDPPPSAHTDSNHLPDDDPLTALRVLRRIVSGLALALALVGLALLGAGLLEDVLRLWNLGLTVLVMAAVAGVATAAAYIGELHARQHHGLERRLDAVEAGERAIAGAMRADDPPDELGQRRDRG